jgi:hypothetical protein
MNNFKRLPLCLVALLFTAPMLAMQKGKKRATSANPTASSEKKNPNADILDVVQATMHYLEIAQLMMHRDAASMALRLQIIKGANANPSTQAPTAAAPAPETASASNAQAQQPAARTMTAQEALKALDAQDESMHKLLSLTSDLARTTIDKALKPQDDDDADDLDDNQGESSNSNNNNNNAE